MQNAAAMSIGPVLQKLDFFIEFGMQKKLRFLVFITGLDNTW